MAKHPNTDLAGIAYLKTVPGIDPTKVATTLPRVSGEVDVTKLRDGGFVRLRSGIGGSPGSAGLRRPVAAVECWAAPPAGSSQVPWGRAADLVEAVYAEASDEFSELDGALLQPPGDYAPVHIHSVRALGEPRRVEGDPSGFARFDLDIEINWTEYPSV